MVLAGKRKGMENENEKKRCINQDNLCFVWGDVHIPNVLVMDLSIAYPALATSRNTRRV